MAAGYDMKQKTQRHRCNCCGYYTLIGTAEDIAWDICPVCFWENDISGKNPAKYSGANHMTLAEGRENYQKCGACDPAMLSHVRLPLAEEMP